MKDDDKTRAMQTAALQKMQVVLGALNERDRLRVLAAGHPSLDIDDVIHGLEGDIIHDFILLVRSLLPFVNENFQTQLRQTFAGHGRIGGQRKKPPRRKYPKLDAWIRERPELKNEQLLSLLVKMEPKALMQSTGRKAPPDLQMIRRYRKLPA